MILAGKRILVTGASGFIGGRLTERLIMEQGARVRGLVRTEANLSARVPGVETCVGDFTNEQAAQRAVEAIDIVVHCAARQGSGTLGEFRRVNVGGTLNLLRAARDKRVERFVHLSTINVHGFPPPADAHADAPLCFTGDNYSRSKAEGEQAARDYASKNDLPLVVIRPGCTYGPRAKAWAEQPLSRVRRRAPVLIDGGQGICNAIYVDNLVDLMFLALENDAAVGQSFMGTEGRGVTWREFYGEFAHMLGGARLNSLPRPAALLAATAFELLGRATRRPPRITRSSVEFYSHHVVYDISKSVSLLGYSPRISFREGMQRTRDWLAAAGKLRDAE